MVDGLTIEVNVVVKFGQVGGGDEVKMVIGGSSKFREMRHRRGRGFRIGIGIRRDTEWCIGTCMKAIG